MMNFVRVRQWNRAVMIVLAIIPSIMLFCIGFMRVI